MLGSAIFARPTILSTTEGGSGTGARAERLGIFSLDIISAFSHFLSVLQGKQKHNQQLRPLPIVASSDSSRDRHLQLPYFDPASTEPSLETSKLLIKHTQEARLTIMNPQSYPTVEGDWDVHFKTKGQSDLAITPVNGTEWDLEEKEGFDLKFKGIKCGDQPISEKNINWIGRKGEGHATLLIKDYSCSQSSHLVSKVLMTGKHHLKFEFAGDVDFAHNYADCTGTTANPCHQCDVDNIDVVLKSPGGITKEYTGFGWQSDSGGCTAADPKVETWSNFTGTDFCPGQGDYRANVSAHAEGEPWEWDTSNWLDIYTCNCVDNSADTAGAAWLEGTDLHWTNGNKECWVADSTTVELDTGSQKGTWWIEGSYMYWIDANQDKRRFQGYVHKYGVFDPSGSIWVEGMDIHYVDANGDERIIDGIAPL